MNKSSFMPFISVALGVTMWAAAIIYYALMPHLTSFAINSYRVIFSFILAGFGALISGQAGVLLEILKSRKNLILLFLCSFFLMCNWSFFVAAIGAGETVEAGMGAYLHPMLGIVMSIFIFRESVSFLKKIAVILALTGIAYMIWIYGKIPYYALGISLSFMVYSALHKVVKVKALEGFFFEMAFVLPFALLYLYFSSDVKFIFDETLYMIFLIIGLGPLTVLGLVTFNYGVQKIPFSTVSFIQFIYPTLTFLIAVFYFNEPLDKGRLIVFAFIWAGVFVYMADTAIHILRKKYK